MGATKVESRKSRKGLIIINFKKMKPNQNKKNTHLTLIFDFFSHEQPKGEHSKAKLFHFFHQKELILSTKVGNPLFLPIFSLLIWLIVRRPNNSIGMSERCTFVIIFFGEFFFVIVV